MPESETERPNTDVTKEAWSRFKEDVHRFLRSKLPTEADADDVLQEVFLQIHEGTHQLKHTDRLQGWVYTIARRAGADFYRSQERKAPAAPLEETPDPLGDAAPGENLSRYEGTHDVHEEVLSWLRPLIEELPEMYRVPLRMADVEGKTQQEVADRLGLSLSGAKSRVQRARVKLGDILRRCCAVEFGEAGRAIAFRRLHPKADACDEGCS